MFVPGGDPIGAWQAVCRHLRDNGGEAFNVLVQFPAAAANEAVMRNFDPHAVRATLDRIGDVANTIFPSRTWSNSADRGGFYQRYKRAHSRGRKKAWGTYFGRFINFGDKSVNQLERIIVAHQAWPGSYKAAFLMHASSSETDVLRRRGGPCLQYVQFCCRPGNQTDLVAVYRNHDYCNKALGNFFGLTRLLKFVCGETGRMAGNVTCLSIHAYSEAPMKTLKKLAGIGN